MPAILKSSSFAGLRLGVYCTAAATALVLLHSLPARNGATAQETTSTESAGPSAEPAPVAAPKSPPTATTAKDTSINIFALAIAGGIFMIPITGMSILSVTMTIERCLGLRTQRVMPEALVSGLGELAAQSSSFDPRKAYRLCQQFPSATANVVRAMLLKVGRPLAEVESAATAASQKEADRLYSNVRWLNLSASLSTMLGLIGTIQGMIMAFHRLTYIDASSDRTSVLADGIYTALVTTFAGLLVAIPTLFASHFFENRILELFRKIDDLVGNLLPQLERYEGRVRFSRQGDSGNGDRAMPPLPDEIAAEVQ